MPDSQAKSQHTDELTLYQANSCPAELLIPYDLSAYSNRSVVVNLYMSKFKQSLLNMDSPLLMAITLIVLLHIAATFTLAILSILFIVPAGLPVVPLALASMSLLLLTVPVYVIIVISNLKINGGRNWQNSLLGPTNIGLTDSGFKLWWQGFAFYNYPNLALWSDIFYIDLKEDARSGEQSLHFIYQSGFGRRTIELPLRGLTNADDARLVLNYFARNVILDHQSDKFKEQAALGFEDSLKKITADTDLYLPMTPE
ncbi:MAG: hypothetical protein P4L53_19690 [Candidatus Obscuribacterales bacterium]|nr:hypothetical protein [Candidatus Obscuribacterales bacterium]